MVAILAWGLHVGALSLAPLSVVQAVISGGLVFLAVFAVRTSASALGVRSLVTAAMLCGAVRGREEGPRVRAFSDLRNGFELLGRDELARLVHDDLAAGDLGRARKRGLELSSRTQVAAIRVDSSACSAVSKKPIEVTTPSPASTR